MLLAFPEPNPTLAFAHCEATQIQWFPYFQKQVQYWLSLIAKAIQIQWFPHAQKQVQHWFLLIAKATQIEFLINPYYIHISFITFQIFKNSKF